MSDYGRQILTRAFDLDDITVSRSGTGRTVTAYAVPFNKTATIRDGQGTYLEQYTQTAFNKTIADKGVNRGVFYNHAMHPTTGIPMAEFSIPLGACRSITADGRGVLTVSEYSKGAFQDQILEGIDSGAIRSQSFSGPVISYTPKVPRTGFRPAADGSLTLVTRTEVGITEYGPTATAFFADAAIISVRSMVERISGLTTDERDELMELLRSTTLTEPVETTDTSTEAVAEAPPTDGHAVRANQAFRHLRLLAREKGAL